MLRKQFALYSEIYYILSIPPICLDAGDIKVITKYSLSSKNIWHRGGDRQVIGHVRYCILIAIDTSYYREVWRHLTQATEGFL